MTIEIASVHSLPPEGGWTVADTIEVQVTAFNADDSGASESFDVTVNGTVVDTFDVDVEGSVTVTRDVDTGVAFDTGRSQTIEVGSKSATVDMASQLLSATKEVRNGFVAIEVEFSGPVDGLSYAGSWDPALPAEPSGMTRSDVGEQGRELGALKSDTMILVPIGEVDTSGTVTVTFVLPPDSREHTFEYSSLMWAANGQRHTYDLLNNTISADEMD